MLLDWAFFECNCVDIVLSGCLWLFLQTKLKINYNSCTFFPFLPDLFVLPLMLVPALPFSCVSVPPLFLFVKVVISSPVFVLLHTTQTCSSFSARGRTRVASLDRFSRPPAAEEEEAEALVDTRGGGRCRKTTQSLTSKAAVRTRRNRAKNADIRNRTSSRRSGLASR